MRTKTTMFKAIECFLRLGLTSTPNDSKLLMLPDEILENICGRHHVVSRVAASLTYHRLNKLIDPMTRAEHDDLIDTSRAGNNPFTQCDNSAIRQYLDRPHDKSSRRRCHICNAYQLNTVFRTKEMSCGYHTSPFLVLRAPTYCHEPRSRFRS